jgi:hypothetical protein
MSQSHELRCYEYVNRPYAVVRDALSEDSQQIFGRATQGATHRASSVAATLRVDLGVIEIWADVTLVVRSVEQSPSSAVGLGPTTRIAFEWQAARSAGLFPAMTAELWIYALSPSETQLDLRGSYTPPFGALGGAIDNVLGHRIAEASVHRFLADVAALLRESLPATKPA